MPDPHSDWPEDIKLGLQDPMEEPDEQPVDHRWESDGLHDGHLEADDYDARHQAAE